jgi:hypothetical protein
VRTYVFPANLKTVDVDPLTLSLATMTSRPPQATSRRGSSPSDHHWNEPDFRGWKPDSLHLGGGPKRATTCKPCLSDAKIHTERQNTTNKVQHLIITLIRVHLFGTCRVQVHQDWIKQK